MKTAVRFSMRAILAGTFALVSAFAFSDAQEAKRLLELDPAGMGEGKRLEAAQSALRMAQQNIDKGESFGQSLDLLLKAKEFDPDLAQAEFELGRLYDDWRVNLRKRALEHYLANATQRPNDARGLTHLANCYRDMGLPAEAEKRYKQAVSADPRANWSLAEYSKFLLEYTDRNAEALDLINKAIAATRPQDQENDAWLWRSSGIANMRTGDKAKARADLERSKAIFQRWGDTWQVGMINMLLGKL